MAVSPGVNLLALAQELQQDCKDAETNIAGYSLDIDCFPPQSHFDFGLRSELTLLERACNKKASTVKQLSQRWATLVHAYIACPTAFEEQIKSGTMRLPGIPEPGDGLNPAEAVFVSVIQLLATQLDTLVSSATCPRVQKVSTFADFSALLHTQHLPLCTKMLWTLYGLKSFQALATEVGLSYQDVEWFSRAIMLRTVMQVAVKQGDMRDEVAAQAVRHAHRLLQLLPHNPASYEFKSYAAMHSPGPESDLACRHMQRAIDSASQSGDYVGVAQYAMQVMYFMLWNFSTSQNRSSDADVLKLELEEVLAMFQNAEALSGLESALGEGVVPSCWHCIVNARLVMATMTVARLAFAIPECPQQLLVHLQQLLTRATSPETKDVKPQRDRQNEMSKDVKAGCDVSSRSKATSQQGQCRNAVAQQRHSSKVPPQDMPPAVRDSSIFKCDVQTSTDRSSKSSSLDSTGFGGMQASISKTTAVYAKKSNTTAFESQPQTSQASNSCTCTGLKLKAGPELGTGT